jgi:hypothetical protein
MQSPCNQIMLIELCKLNGLTPQQEFKAILNITGMDTLGLTNELTKVISNNMNVNIQSIALKAMLDCLRTTNSNCTKHYFEKAN